jgi:hypothetical protein
MCAAQRTDPLLQRGRVRKETYSPVLLLILLDFRIGGVPSIVPRRVINTELLGPTLLRLGIFHLLSGEMRGRGDEDTGRQIANSV